MIGLVLFFKNNLLFLFLLSVPTWNQSSRKLVETSKNWIKKIKKRRMPGIYKHVFGKNKSICIDSIVSKIFYIVFDDSHRCAACLQGFLKYFAPCSRKCLNLYPLQRCRFFLLLNPAEATTGPKMRRPL